MKLLRRKRTSGLTTGKMIATVSSIAVAAGVMGGAGVVYGPKLVENMKSGSSGGVEVGTEVKSPNAESAGEGFKFGNLSAEAAVESIEVTIKTGSEGAALDEKLDLHLGLGFPLRLYPLGEDAMNPAFAAFPQKSSLERGQNAITAGESATFEFLAQGEAGQDALGTTPQLLKDLTVGDMEKIGFASLGGADWILEGYTIKVNGELFASNDSVNAQPKILLDGKRDQLTTLIPQNEALLTEISELEAYIATGLAGDADKGELSNKKAELEVGAGPVNDLAGQTSGYYPWYLEEDEKFTPTVSLEAPIGKLGITVLAGGGQQPGTRNPMYIKAGGKKFQLTSEMDPLADINSPQDFVISMADLKVSPIAKGDLENIGVGVIGNEERFGKIPDRAKVQRLVVTADGEQIYDSERKAEDRKALEAFWLVPPVHLDNEGEFVANEEKGAQKYLWITGMAAPERPAPKPEPEPLPVILKPTPLPVPPKPAPLPVPPKPGPGKIVDTNKPLPIPPKPGVISPLPGPAVTQRTTFTGSPSGTFVPTGTVNPLTGLQQGSFVAGSGNPGFTSVRRKNQNLGPLNPNLFITPPNPTPKAATLTLADQLKLITAIANLIKPAPPAPSPGKITQPKASNVRFSDGVHTAEFGRPVTVKWDVQPGTAGAKSVSKFKVNLFAVNMETGVTLTPALATATTTTGTTRSITLPMPDPDTASWPLAPAQVAKNKVHLLYLQPQVVPMETASGADTAIANASSPGSVVPVLPNPSSYNTAGVTFSLKPGPKEIWNAPFTAPLYTVSGSALASYTGKFQVEDGVLNSASSWVDLDFLTPAVGKPDTAAYLQGTPVSTLSGFQITPPEDVTKAKVHHFAARNSKAVDQISLVYEGEITYPATTAKVRGYRLVGNIGFLSGAKVSPANPASVALMVDLHGDGTGSPRLRQNAGAPAPADLDSNANAGDTHTPLATFQSAWMRLMTQAGFIVNSSSPTTTQAFDIPIRFDLMDAAAGNPATLVTSYQALTPTGVAAFAPLTPFGSAIGDPANHMFQTIGAADLTTYANAKARNPRKIGVTFTIKVSTGTSPASLTDSLGVFGVRLVPDVYY